MDRTPGRWLRYRILDESIKVAEWERMEDGSVDDAEERRVRTDTESQHGNHGDGHTRSFGEAAKGMEHLL